MKQKTQGRELSTLVPAVFIFSDYDEYAVISYSLPYASLLGVIHTEHNEFAAASVLMPV